MYASLITLSFLSTIITYTIVVIDALQSGNKSKETCILRSSLVGFVHSVFYTKALNSFTYGHLAVRYHIVSVAPKELAIKLQWLLWRQAGMEALAAPLLFQAAFGIFHGLNHYVLCMRRTLANLYLKINQRSSRMDLFYSKNSDIGEKWKLTVKQ